MVGYDTKYKRDKEDDGYTLSVFMHWGDDEKPPKNRKEAMCRLSNIIFPIQEILEKINEDT